MDFIGISVDYQSLSFDQTLYRNMEIWNSGISSIIHNKETTTSHYPYSCYKPELLKVKANHGRLY